MSLGTSVSAQPTVNFSPGRSSRTRQQAGWALLAFVLPASSLADELKAALLGSPDSRLRDASLARNKALRAAFAATPYRPTRLTAPGQAFANLVESLEWCCSLVGEIMRVGPEIASGPGEDRLLVDESCRLLRAVAVLLSGHKAAPDIEGVKQLIASARDRAWNQVITNEHEAAAARLMFSVRYLAVAAQSAATDALIASRRADDELIARARRGWYSSTGTAVEAGRAARLRSMGAVAARHASLRSVCLINSLRGALALAAAVAVADLTGVQHGFWVALGTLSVLRTSAAATGATAFRALAGTAAGFVIGSVVVVAIGSDTAVLWAILPIAVCAAAYCAGTAPFAAGQAAFTVLVAVLFNLIVPAGWRVGVVRIEDVALGCAVSVVVGALLWPRGAVRVVGDDLADAFREGSSYLSESMDWILGRSPAGHQEPSGGAPVAAGRRRDAVEAHRTLPGPGTAHAAGLRGGQGRPDRMDRRPHVLVLPAGAHPGRGRCRRSRRPRSGIPVCSQPVRPDGRCYDP